MMIEKIILPPDHFKKRVRNQYSRVEIAICREIVQNSQDAGASKVEFAFSDCRFQAKDNGCGMDLESFRQFYLTLGGTKKETGSIGGFGAAKELLSFAWDNWGCHGQEFSVTGSGACNPESSTDHGIAKGFEVWAQDDALDCDKLQTALFELCALSDLKCSIILQNANSETAKVPHGRKLRSNQKVKEFTFGTLYVHKSKPGAWERAGNLYIRTKGLYTAEVYVGGDYVWYLDLHATSPEVLTENRDGLRYKVKTEVLKETQAISRNPSGIENKPNAKLRIYGASFYGASAYNSHIGNMGIEQHDNNLWRLPFAIGSEKETDCTNGQGLLKPKFAKALEIWQTTLNMICDCVEFERPIPGLYFGASIAVCFDLGQAHAICCQPSVILKATPFEILETAMHELAHYERSDHSQEYEVARMSIACKVGASAGAILDTIRRKQGESAKRGKYWQE